MFVHYAQTDGCSRLGAGHAAVVEIVFVRTLRYGWWSGVDPAGEVAVTGLFDGFEGYRILADADVDHALTSALVAVDANVLLNLYRYNAQTTEDLLAVFEKLGDRLVVPHQAVR